MKIVFIHGRSQQSKDPEKLKAAWTNALLDGFAALGLPSENSLDVIFPYYGDFLFTATEKTARGEFQRLVDKGADAASPSPEEQQFVQDLVFAMAEQQGISRERISQEAYGDVVEKDIQNWRAVLAALRLLNEISGVASASIEYFTRDVWCYLTQLGVRRKVNDIVASAVPKDEPCVIVGHSLGSIVAYNVLMNMEDRANVRKFVTVGSPLGIEAIYSRLPSDTPPRKAPAGVQEWFNARDPRDVVALFEIPSRKYRGEPIAKNYSEVINNSENRHGIEEYLRDPMVAKSLQIVLI